MKNILAAIMTKFSGSAVSTDVGGRIYFGVAPEVAEYPHIVFFNINAPPDKTFTENYESYQIQFSLFSKSEGLTEISTMYADLISLLDECTMTITSNSLIYCNRLGSPQTMTEEVTTPDGTATIHHWAIDYEIMTRVTG